MLRKVGQRRQRTLKEPVSVAGLGYLFGSLIHVRFCPAPPNHGLAFLRTDRANARPLPALGANVAGANRRTTLGRAPEQVELVEHALAALAGLKIDNCLIEVSGPELPGLDGSSLGFVAALCDTRIVTQNAVRPIWAADAPIQVADEKGTLTLHPTDGTALTVTYLLDYGPGSPLGKQMHTQPVTPTDCLNGFFENRTFLLEAEAAALRQQGVGSAAGYGDLLVFGPKGPLGNELRHENEPARHKSLDMVGDLALFGADLAGHLVGCKSGHSHNTQLVRKLAEALPGQAAAPLRRAA